MLDGTDDHDLNDHSAELGPYPEHPSQTQQSPFGHPLMNSMTSLQPTNENMMAPGVIHQPFDPFDPMLDADPFGLTASMHYPTQFQESSIRR